MIPYALLMMKFIWKDRTLDLRALDPVEDGVSFRLAKAEALQLDLRGKPDHVECFFLQNQRRTYRRVALYEFKLRLLDTDEAYDSYTISSGQEDFRGALAELIRDYTDYVGRMLSLDEISAMEEMTGHELGDEYPKSLSEWLKMVKMQSDDPDPKASLASENRQMDESPKADRWEKLKPVEIAICLDSPKLWQAFCSLDRPAFLRLYWEENGLTGHPITQYPVSCLYIGNQFCPLLFPKKTELAAIIQRAEAYDWKRVYVFSTMSEGQIPLYEDRIRMITDTAEKAGSADGQAAELVVNDLGTVMLLYELLPKEKAGLLSVTLGTLLMKRKKDVRLTWREGWQRDAAANEETSLDSALYRDYLRDRFCITKVSYEACGYPIKILGKGNALHLPFYQTNTSGYCTLYALCKNGDRERQEDLKECPDYCREKMVFYPKPLPMIGRFNSLFGCSFWELNDLELLNDYIDRGIGRLVIGM